MGQRDNGVGFECWPLQLECCVRAGAGDMIGMSKDEL